MVHFITRMNVLIFLWKVKLSHLQWLWTNNLTKSSWLSSLYLLYSAPYHLSPWMKYSSRDTAAPHWMEYSKCPCVLFYTQNSAWHIVCGVVENFTASSRISNKGLWVWIITSRIKYICYDAAAVGALQLRSGTLHFYIFSAIHIPDTVGVNTLARFWIQGFCSILTGTWHGGADWILDSDSSPLFTFYEAVCLGCGQDF